MFYSFAFSAPISFARRRCAAARALGFLGRGRPAFRAAISRRRCSVAEDLAPPLETSRPFQQGRRFDIEAVRSRLVAAPAEGRRYEADTSRPEIALTNELT